MKKNTLIFIIILVAITNISCNNNKEKKALAEDNVIKIDEKFIMPDIPVTISQPEERAKYLLLHYWDNLNFADTVWNTNPNFEQAFVDYVDLFNYADSQAIIPSVDVIIKKSIPHKTTFNWFTEIFERYLYDVNSPMRNEYFYSLVLGCLNNAEDVDQILKTRYKYQLEQINKNAVGEIASDFKYTTSDNKTNRLHNIKSQYTLIFFYDPDCNDCLNTKKMLMQSDVIRQLINNKQMTIIAMYVYEDIELWKGNTQQMPDNWITAYDATTDLEVKNKLYAIRAIPSLYLLDEDKKVILRDAVAETVISGFSPRK